MPANVGSMSHTMDAAPVPFMAARAVDRPREDHAPAAAHLGAPVAPGAPSAPIAPLGATLPPIGADATRKPELPAETKAPADAAHLARAPEPPSAPEPPKLTELPKPVEAKETNGGPVSSLDAPAQPPKESAIPGIVPAKAEPAPFSAASVVSALSAPAPADTLNKPTLPRPVEVKSVPDTPVNNSTPAGGTPRPVLDISQEPIKAPEPEKVELEPAVEKPAAEKPTITSAPAPAPVPAAAPAEPEPVNGDKPEPVVSAPSAAPAPAPAAGQKRKLEEDEPQAEKKTKVEAETEAKPERKKAGRPKKDKKAPAPVGRTQRKTRSQGPAEAEL